jgi:hypothetical protein
LHDLKAFNPKNFGKLSLFATKCRQAATNDTTVRNALLGATLVPYSASALPSAWNNCHSFMSLYGETLSVNLPAVGNSLLSVTNFLMFCRGLIGSFKNGVNQLEEVRAWAKSGMAMSSHFASGIAAISCVNELYGVALLWALVTVYYALPLDDGQVVLTSCQETYLLDYLTQEPVHVSKKRSLIKDMINKYVASVEVCKVHQQ